MLLNSKEQLIVDHMNAIAKFFGGWKDEENVNPRLIEERFNILHVYEMRCHTSA